MKINIRLLKIAAFLLVFLVPLAAAGCKSAGKVTFDQLFATPEKYDGKSITIEGFYFQGFETNVLCPQLKSDAPGHVVPDGKMIWVEGGLPKEIYDQLSRQQTAGPLERYGKVRLTGKFSYGGRYGHLGGFNFQISVTEAKLLYWSTP